MKKLIFTIAIFVVSIISKATDKERFMQAMKQTIMELNQAKNIAELQVVANKFERIANLETTEWLPNYYASLCYSRIALEKSDGNDKDKYLDKSDLFIEKLLKQNAVLLDEVEVLKALNYKIRISVNGPVRWLKFSSAFDGAITKAKKINPDNPRAYAQKAQMVYHTPSFFGGGPEKACPEVQKAITRFTNFKPTSPIAPTWGADQLKGLDCK